jgi:hypothetical protein
MRPPLLEPPAIGYGEEAGVDKQNHPRRNVVPKTPLSPRSPKTTLTVMSTTPVKARR